MEGTHRALDECIQEAQIQGLGWSLGYVYTEALLDGGVRAEERAVHLGQAWSTAEKRCPGTKGPVFDVGSTAISCVALAVVRVSRCLH